jgi:hypothetical protein
MNRIWLFRNNVYHEANQGRITQAYKKEELTNWMGKMCRRHSYLQRQLQEFQHKHVGEIEVTGNFRYDTQRCGASLAPFQLTYNPCDQQ